LLFGVTAADPPTYVAAVVMVVLTSILASYLPARRATSVDPVQSLGVSETRLRSTSTAACYYIPGLLATIRNREVRAWIGNGPYHENPRDRRLK
jgi:hypothetical protein